MKKGIKRNTEQVPGRSQGRWLKAQYAEHNTASGILQRTGVSKLILDDSKKKETMGILLHYTSKSTDELLNMSILEIGGYLIEQAFDIPYTFPKLVLDPLPSDMVTVIKKDDSPNCRIRGLAEFIPLANKTIDLCWMTNTIDHVLDPVAALYEINRVLKEQGILVISCNVFSEWLNWFIPLMNVIDTPHPNHFTLASFQSIVRDCGFEINSKDEGRFRFSFKRGKGLSIFRDLKLKIAILFTIWSNEKRFAQINRLSQV
jgi:SAM-dependent methyltransferase